MSPAPTTTAILARICADAARCLAAAGAVIVLAGAVVVVGGVADDARDALGFGFAGVQGSPVQAGRIALDNARIAFGTLLAAIVMPHLTQRARRAVLCVLATVLVCNAATIGIAAGAYGARLAGAIAVHAPVEFAALALAGGACLQACRQALGARVLAIVAAVTGVLLVAAAGLETFVSPRLLR